MPEVRSIPVTSLLLDHENPRLPSGIRESQLDTLQAMLRVEGPKTLALAESIAEDGLSVIDRLIAIPGQDGRYIVLLLRES